jgi:hypothetical protein
MSAEINRDPKILDVVDAIHKLKRFSDFTKEFSRIAVALAGAGVDISRINPNNISDLFRLVQGMGKAKDIREEDIEHLKREYGDVMNLSLGELKSMCYIIRQFISINLTVDSTVSYMSRTAKAGKEELDMMKTLLGIKTAGEEPVEEEIEIGELSDEELEELRNFIKRKT